MDMFLRAPGCRDRVSVARERLVGRWSRLVALTAACVMAAAGGSSQAQTTTAVPMSALTTSWQPGSVTQNPSGYPAGSALLQANGTGWSWIAGMSFSDSSNQAVYQALRDAALNSGTLTINAAFDTSAYSSSNLEYLGISTYQQVGASNWVQTNVGYASTPITTSQPQTFTLAIQPASSTSSLSDWSNPPILYVDPTKSTIDFGFGVNTNGETRGGYVITSMSVTAAPRVHEDYVWAGNGTIPGGSGFWSTVFQDTTWLANGQGAGVEWAPAKRAVFRSSGGTVSVSGTVVANDGMQFDTSGFTIVSDTNPAYSGRISLAGSVPDRNSISVASGATANVNLPLVGTNGLTKNGSGTLVLGAASTVSGSAVVASGKILDSTGQGLSNATIVVAPGGTYETPAGVALDSNSLRLTGGTLAVQKLNVTTGLELPVVINDFETVDDLYGSTNGMTNIALSTTAGVTSGSSSMGMTWTQGSDYDWSFKSYSAEALDAWKSHKVLAIDVTQVNSGTGGGNIAGNVAFNGPMGWNQTGNGTYPRFINYPWLGAGGSTTTTYYWDYSALSASGTDTWFQVNLAGSLGGNWGTQQVYFDNMRLLDPVVPTASGIGRFVIESGTIAGSPDLAVFNGGRMVMPSDRQMTLSVHSLSVTETNTEPGGGGGIDLGGGRIEIAAGGITAAELVADIVAGRAGGTWNGATGITSSLAASDVAASIPRAVGWLDNGPGGLVVAFAAPGDTNLDGLIDVLDAAAFVGSGKFDTGDPAAWNQGDFTYDGIVDVLDAAAVVSTGLFDFGPYNTLPSGQPAASIAAVPEPAMATAACVLGVLAAVHAARRGGRSGSRRRERSAV